MLERRAAGPSPKLLTASTAHRPWRGRGGFTTFTVLSKSFPFAFSHRTGLTPNYLPGLAKSTIVQSLCDSFLNGGINSSYYENRWFQRTTALFPQSDSVGTRSFLVAVGEAVTASNKPAGSSPHAGEPGRQARRDDTR